MGTTTVTTAGTEVQVRNVAAEKVRAISFKARVANTGVIYVGGDSAVSSTNGYTLSAGESVSIDYGDRGGEDAKTFWVDCSVNGERVDWILITDI